MATTETLNRTCTGFGRPCVRQVHWTNIEATPTMSASGRLKFTMPTNTKSALTEITPLTPGSQRSNFRQRSEEHTSELQSHSDLVCRLLLEKKKQERRTNSHRSTAGLGSASISH